MKRFGPSVAALSVATILIGLVVAAVSKPPRGPVGVNSSMPASPSPAAPGDPSPTPAPTAPSTHGEPTLAPPQPPSAATVQFERQPRGQVVFIQVETGHAEAQLSAEASEGRPYQP